MISIALIPILAVLALVALSAFVISRRSANVARLKKRVEDRVASILRQDAENDQTFVDAIIGGTSTDQAITHHLGARRSMLLAPGLANPAHWTGENVDAWRQDEIQRGIEAVNRKLSVPAIGTALLIVAATIVGVAVLYSFESQQPTTISTEQTAPQPLGAVAASPPGTGPLKIPSPLVPSIEPLPATTLDVPWSPQPSAEPDLAPKVLIPQQPISEPDTQPETTPDVPTETPPPVNEGTDA